MDHSEAKRDLLVLGVHLKSEGYPNTLYRLRDLQLSGLFRINEINVPMWAENTRNRHGFSRLTRNVFRAVMAHFEVILRYLMVSRRSVRVYVPYPCVFLLFFLSCLPKRFRPERIVVDVFISLYDTIVLDRQLLKREGLPARLLKLLERRAYRYADKIVVDTEQNARFLSSLFEIPEEKTVVVSLSTDETHFKCTPYIPRPGICRVLFVGTLVPLHGISTILEAVRLLSDRPDIHVKLIGNGQDAPLVKAWLEKNVGQLEWEKDWQTSAQIAREIARADICLGVFGVGNKTQRVCPFKIYAYAAMGRAIITGQTDWLEDSSSRLSYKPFGHVPVNNAEALAAQINLLANDPCLRAQLAINSYEFYSTHLANRLSLKKIAYSILLD